LAFSGFIVVKAGSLSACSFSSAMPSQAAHSLSQDESDVENLSVGDASVRVAKMLARKNTPLNLVWILLDFYFITGLFGAPVLIGGHPFLHGAVSRWHGLQRTDSCTKVAWYVIRVPVYSIWETNVRVVNVQDRAN
jgi:hypothetical protein